MHSTSVRFAIAALFAATAVFGCGDSHGPSEATGQTAEAVTLSITLANEVGRTISAGNGLARKYFTYDVRGRATGVEHVLDDTPYVFTSTYGFPCSGSTCSGTTVAPNGSVVVQATFPDGETVSTTYDAGGASQSIATQPTGKTAQTIVSKVLRNARGQTVEVDYGDLTSTVHHYNDTTDLRLNELETYVTATPTTVLQLYQYSFDGNGNVTAVTDNCNEASTGTCSASQENTTYSSTFSYDSRDELVQAVRGGTTYAYGYDAVGNITNMEGTTQTYFPSGAGQPTPHALKAVGSVDYQYDANGNTTGTTGAASNLALTWNAENMPVSSVYSGGTTSKSFVGETLWKKVLASTTTYYLPAMRVENGVYRKYFGGYAERDASDTTRCANPNPGIGCLEFYHGDYLGSSTLAVEVEGTLANPVPAVSHRQAYTPYGKDIVSPAPGPFTPKYQFNFKEPEADLSGLYDYGARLYNPAVGRWLSPDNATSDNYKYVKNRPVQLADPTGHQDEDPQHKAHTQAAEEQRASGLTFGLPWLKDYTAAFKNGLYNIFDKMSNVPVVGGVFHLGLMSADYASGDKKEAGIKLAMAPIFFLPEGDGAELGGKGLKTIMMDPYWIGKDAANGVRYFTGEERELFKLAFKEGKIFKANGELFHTAGEYGLFVMDKHGTFYGFETTANEAIHHSSFFAGGRVSAAGGMQVEEGVLKVIDNGSGHYRPPTSTLDTAAKELNRRGVSGFELSPMEH